MLTQTDLVILRIYTYEMMVGKHVYSVLNETLRSRGAQRISQLAPFKKYLWMLLKALSKIEPYRGPPTVYRALNIDISASCQEGKVFTAHDFFSTSRKLDKCEQFLRGSGTKGTLLIIQLRPGGTRARDIRAFSIFQEEEEILLASGGRYEILGKPTDAGGAFVIVQLQEIDPLERDAILGINRGGVDAFLPLPVPPPPVLSSVHVPNPAPAVDVTRAVEEAVARERQLAMYVFVASRFVIRHYSVISYS